MARKGRIYSNFHCLFCAKIRKSSDIYDKYGHFFTVSSILQRILFVFSQINPLLSPCTLPRHLVCRRKCLSVFQHCRRPAHEGLRLFPRERIFSPREGGKNLPRMHSLFHVPESCGLPSYPSLYSKQSLWQGSLAVMMYLFLSILSLYVD